MTSTPALSREEVLEKINTLRAYARNITNLNCGGCGVFALKACKALRKLGVPSRIKVTTDQQTLDNAMETARRRTVSAIEDCGASFSHLFVEADLPGGSVWFDSDVLYEQLKNFGWRSKEHLGNLTIEQAAPIVRSRDGWNDLFDRRDGYPKINKAVKMAFGLSV